MEIIPAPKGTEYDFSDMKVVLTQEQPGYTVGETIRGLVEYFLPASFTEVATERRVQSFHVVLHLKCFEKPGDEEKEAVISYDQYTILRTVNAPFASGLMAPGSHKIPFEITLSPRIQGSPPTSKKEELGGMDCRVTWVVAARVEALHDGHLIEHPLIVDVEKEVKIYHFLRDLTWKGDSELQRRAFTSPLYKLTICDVPVSYPRAPALFDVHLDLEPNRALFLRSVTVELVVKFTVRDKDEATSTFERKELIGSAVLYYPVWKPTTLRIKGCKIARHGPLSLNSQCVADFVHMLSVTVKEMRGSSEHRLAVNVEPPSCVATAEKSGT